MLGHREQKHYLNIARGKIVRRSDKGTETFDFVEGLLLGISKRDREFNGEKVPYWYLDLSDPRSGEVYTLGVRASSGVWRSIILSLGSLGNPASKPIRIEPYKVGGFDRVSVYTGEDRLPWLQDLPPVEERDQVFESIVNNLNSYLHR